MTYIAGYDLAKRPPNVRVVFVPDVQIFERLPNLFSNEIHTAMSFLYDDMKTVCVKALAYEEVQKLRDEKFDLLILHIGLTECFLTFAYELQVCNYLITPGKNLESLRLKKIKWKALS